MKLRPLLLAPEPGDTGTGPDQPPATPASAPSAEPSTPLSAAPDAAPASAPAADSAPSAKADDPSKPKTMHEAMFGKEEPAAAPAKPSDKPQATEAQATPKPEDLTVMPEGLTKPAQERFQKLANTNKELAERHESVMQAVAPFQQVLQENGVRKEQFDQAAGVIGLINRGDLEGALKVIDEQRRQISLVLGKPLPGVDALAGFDDLRQRVSDMQISEADAIELARGRANQQAHQTRQTQQRQQQESQAQQGQATQAGLNAVDAFTKRMQAQDLDFAAIESKLLPRIPDLIAGVPPAQWATKVQQLYELIKDAAGSGRGGAAPATNSLRPTGSKSPSQQPKSMHEAMWGQAA